MHGVDWQHPAFLDSLGWVHFKRGETQKALGYLRRAYAGQPDQEVAAHLAEALVVLDQTTEARALVESALAGSEIHPDIDDLLLRYPQLAP